MDAVPDIEALDWHAALAALAWQVDLGVCEATAEHPVDRYALAEAGPSARPKAPAVTATAPALPPAIPPDPVEAARDAAARARTLPELRAALAAFEPCELRLGARNLVFAEGTPGAHLMIVGDAPDSDGDREGRPFTGPAGALLDRMLGAIGVDRASSDPARGAYVVPALPWRVPGDREAEPAQADMLRPFLARHVALAAPRVVIAMGNRACDMVLGKRGIARLRGTWDAAQGVPVMPMAHPAALLRAPETKREAWADLLAVRARLGPVPPGQGDA